MKCFFLLAVVATSSLALRPVHDLVYTIWNKETSGVLTFRNGTTETVDDVRHLIHWDAPAITQFNSSDPLQRWRIDAAVFGDAFQLRPVSNENFVLEYIPEQRLLRWLSYFGTTKKWYIMHAGQDYVMIRHHRYEVCLEARLDMNVTAAQCNGNGKQQWKFENNPPVSSTTVVQTAAPTTSAPETTFSTTSAPETTSANRV